MKISELLSDISNRDLVLPVFQREYVWSKDQAKKLMESLRKGYPVGPRPQHVYLIHYTARTIPGVNVALGLTSAAMVSGPVGMPVGATVRASATAVATRESASSLLTPPPVHARTPIASNPTAKMRIFKSNPPLDALTSFHRCSSPKRCWRVPIATHCT